MPADKNNRRTKQYGIPAISGSNTPETSVRVAPASPNRTMLIIQNTGDNDGMVRFDGAIQGDGTDMLFPAGGAGLVFDRASTCPEAEIWVGSADGTTFSFVEQVTQ